MLLTSLAGPAGAVEPDAEAGGIWVEHVVVQGDTVFLIATHYGSTVDRIVRVNRIADVRRLFVGLRLRVPVVRVPSPRRAEMLRSARSEPAAPSLDEMLRRGETELAEARFGDALQTVQQVLASGSPEIARPLRSRLELVSATAQIAMGESELALASMQRALRADPSLTLDPNNTSPKVQAVYFRAVQAQR